MWIGIVSLFPEMFRAVMQYGLVSRALAAGHLDIRLANPRDFAADKHRTVDDAPYGGGPGQVMMAEPLAQAAESLVVLVDALARRIPGVLGNAESLAHESFTAGRLEGAHYTRPRLWRGETVPETLLSGDHAAVESWRARSAFKRTYERRPELFKGRPLDAHETTFIEDLQKGGDHA